MVFVVRQGGVATVVAVFVPGRIECAVFATASFLAQAPTVASALALFRLTQALAVLRRG
jgi:hypothetical protein